MPVSMPEPLSILEPAHVDFYALHARGPYDHLREEFGLLSRRRPGRLLKVDDMDFTRPRVVPEYLTDTLLEVRRRDMPVKLVTFKRGPLALRSTASYLVPEKSPLRYTFRALALAGNLLCQNGLVVLRENEIVTSMTAFSSASAPQLTPRMSLTPEQMRAHPAILFVTIGQRNGKKTETDLLNPKEVFVPVRETSKLIALRQ